MNGRMDGRTTDGWMDGQTDGDVLTAGCPTGAHLPFDCSDRPASAV